MNHLPPQVPKNNIRAISNLSKTPEEIRNSRCTTGINDTGGKFSTSTAVMRFSGAWWKLTHEKNLNRKSRGTVPIKY
jgi:hypothetical protein